MGKATFTGVFLLIILAACQSPKEKSLERIRSLEVNDSVFSPRAIEELKTAYLDFADKYPDDELAPEFLFKAGQRCNATGAHEEAIALFQRIIDRYPKSRMAEEALFLQAYVYENSLQNLVKAKDTYTIFLKKYPTSELAEDAQMAIANLGKTPEEIFEGFKQRKDTLS